MKLINPSVELYPQENYTLEGIYKQIEKCARVSYKSEDKITKDSSKEFVDNLIKAKHHAPLEFGTVYLSLPIDYNSRGYIELDKFYNNNPYSRVSYEAGIAYLTTNYRVLVEHNRLDDLKYLCEPTEYHHKRHCVKFITSRSIANEILRHRVFSFMQESQRFCNYSKKGFGNEITFVKPYWLKNVPAGKVYWHDGICYRIMYNEDTLDDISVNPNQLGYDTYIKLDTFLHSLDVAERHYFDLIKQDCKPQEAREVLPNATKTELVMCGFEDDFRHFFNLRLRNTTGKAHPDMVYLAQQTWDLFKENYGIEL